MLGLRFYAKNTYRNKKKRARARAENELIAHRYREAKPRLDMVKAKAALDRGKTVCFFFDERDNFVGEALVIHWSDVGLGLGFSGDCFEQSAVSAGWADRIDLDLVKAGKKNSSGQARLYLVCPRCRKAFGILIYAGQWACGKCLKLGYRSQFVPPDVFASLQLAALQTKIGPGRPRGMRQANYRKAKKDLETLKKIAGSFPSEASVAHRRVIRAVWLTPAEAGRVTHPDYELVEGKITPRPGIDRGPDEAPKATRPIKPSVSAPAKPPIPMVAPWLDDDDDTY